MCAANKLNLERVISESQPDTGYIEDAPQPLGAWNLGAGTTIAAAGSGIVGVSTVTSTNAMNVLLWNATADSGDTVRLDWTLPGQFKSKDIGQGEAPVLQLLIKARLRDTTGSATANADLALTAQAVFHKLAQTSIGTLSAVVSNTVGATDYAEAAVDGFAWYTFDIYGAMSAAQKTALSPLDSIQFVVGPQEAVGTALALEVMSTVIRYRRHAGLESMSSR
jgi:hypothetical protein